jgi:hypothetical protein
MIIAIDSTITRDHCIGLAGAKKQAKLEKLKNIAGYLLFKTYMAQISNL